MHAGTPIVCSDVVEVANLVKQHDLGIVLTDYTPEQMAKVIGNLLSDTDRMHQLKRNCEKAALVENWEKETEILQRIYANVN